MTWRLLSHVLKAPLVFVGTILPTRHPLQRNPLVAGKRLDHGPCLVLPINLHISEYSLSFLVYVISFLASPSFIDIVHYFKAAIVRPVALRGKNAPSKRAPKSIHTDTADSVVSGSSKSSKIRPTSRALDSPVAQIIQKRVMKKAQIYLGLHDAFPDDDEDTLAVFLLSMYETTVSELLEDAVGVFRSQLKREINRYRTEPLTYAVFINKLVRTSSCHRPWNTTLTASCQTQKSCATFRTTFRAIIKTHTLTEYGLAHFIQEADPVGLREAVKAAQADLAYVYLVSSSSSLRPIVYMIAYIFRTWTPRTFLMVDLSC